MQRNSKIQKKLAMTLTIGGANERLWDYTVSDSQSFDISRPVKCKHNPARTGNKKSPMVHQFAT